MTELNFRLRAECGVDAERLELILLRQKFKNVEFTYKPLGLLSDTNISIKINNNPSVTSGLRA